MSPLLQATQRLLHRLGEVGLFHHQVAAHLDDLRDRLAENRTFLMTRPPGRTGVLAAAALGASLEIEEMFPGVLADRRGAEPLRLFEIDRLQDAGSLTTSQQDIGGGGQDVQADAVWEIGDEGE